MSLRNNAADVGSGQHSSARRSLGSSRTTHSLFLSGDSKKKTRKNKAGLGKETARHSSWTMPSQGAFVLEGSEDSPVLLAARYFGEQLFGEDEEQIKNLLMTAQSLQMAGKNAELITMLLEHFPKVLESTGLFQG